MAMTPDEIQAKAALEEEAAFVLAQKDDLLEQIDILSGIAERLMGLSRQEVNRHVAELRHKAQKARRES